MLEFLIASTIAFFLMIGVWQAVIVSKKQLNNMILGNDLLNKVNKTFYYIKSDIHRSGFIGCAKLTKNFPLYWHGKRMYDAANKIVGSTHEFSVWFADKRFSTLLSMDKSLKITKGYEPNIKDDLIISDCTRAEIFNIKNIKVHKEYIWIEPLQKFYYLFNKNSEVSKVIYHRYFVGISKYNHQNVLYVDDGEKKYELLNGINKIQIKYAIYKQSKLFLLNAKSIKDWESVVGIFLKIQMNSHLKVKEYSSFIAL